ncbi:ISAzo13-like element transposase-related protein [Nitrosomonas communis]|uniref:ISAzo13-like element transposase-related protein n=1 Tax=Nitrosomonas communis TaxID=44574 RepID=UPI0015A53F3E|nr:hypothetical protein [Nitrosomonas communis]
MRDTKSTHYGSGQLHLTFGSSFKTSHFIVDGLEGWLQAIPKEKQVVMTHIQLKVDNGQESSGVRKWCGALSSMLMHELIMLSIPLKNVDEHV